MFCTHGWRWIEHSLNWRNLDVRWYFLRGLYEILNELKIKFLQELLVFRHSVSCFLYVFDYKFGLLVVNLRLEFLRKLDHMRFASSRCQRRRSRIDYGSPLHAPSKNWKVFPIIFMQLTKKLSTRLIQPMTRFLVLCKNGEQIPWWCCTSSLAFVFIVLNRRVSARYWGHLQQHADAISEGSRKSYCWRVIVIADSDWLDFEIQLKWYYVF